MATFTISAVNDSGEPKTFYYDNENSALSDEQGAPVFKSDIPAVFESYEKNPVGKGQFRNFTTIKISLGLSCNYSCEYCSQRFVPHSEETNQHDIDKFLSQIPSWYRGGLNGKGAHTKFEFWGGEPFVYWKTLKPLAERIRMLYPEAWFSLITNGSLLDDEKLDWLDRLNFGFAISHDGPGQSVRGPDPFDTEEGVLVLKKAIRRFGPSGRVSINSMMNRTNSSRVAIQKYFENLLGEDAQYLSFGEGGFVDAYDEGGLANSLESLDSEVAYRRQAYADIDSGGAFRFSIVKEKITGFAQMIADRRPADTLGQKCGMDRRGNIAVDLLGNVLTCQNVSAVGTNPAGASHKLGTVSNIDAIRMTSVTHWSDRQDCKNCPVLQLCQGSCMFLSGDLWDASCKNAFSDSVVFFAATIKAITGYKPIHIDGPQPNDRKYIWEAKGIQKRSVIPIKVAA